MSSFSSLSLGPKIPTRGVSEGQRRQPRIHPRSHITPFVPQGGATRDLSPQQGLRALATLSLDYAKRCDWGDASRPPP